MDNIIKVEKDNQFIYDIVIEKDYDELSRHLVAIIPATAKICIVTDSIVGPIYADKLKQVLSKDYASIFSYEFVAGEENKNLDSISGLYEFLINKKFTRDDKLIALGGGVVGDMCGFAAATYLRGIDFIQMPTTLLSMVDSSIGGKTGVDYMAYKNMVGAFYMPKLVYVATDHLSTLDDKQFASGMAEVIKHGLIKSESYFEFLSDSNNIVKIKNKEYDAIVPMIIDSIKIKRDVVSADPYEKGERALLNFGHTVGHAVEKLLDFKYLHGECVAIGIVAASYLSNKYLELSNEDFDKICDILKSYDLPVISPLKSREEILFTTKSDKKMTSSGVKFVVLNGIGKSSVKKDFTDSEILDAIDQIISVE